MLYIHCPHCNENRDESEFACAGEAYIPRPETPQSISDAEWGDYLFGRRNVKGRHFEQWQHAHACRKLFVVERDTVTNRILATGTFDELRDKWKKWRDARAASGAAPLLEGRKRTSAKISTGKTGSKKPGL